MPCRVAISYLHLVVVAIGTVSAPAGRIIYVGPDIISVNPGIGFPICYAVNGGIKPAMAR